MQYFAMTVEEKNELCSQGHKCLGCHRILMDKIYTGDMKWEFDIPEEKKDTGMPPNGGIAGKQEKPEEIKEPRKQRGNPNWVKRNK